MRIEKGYPQAHNLSLGIFFWGKGDIELTLSANILISVFYLATVFYAASLILLPLPNKAWSIAFLCLGLAANLVSTIIRHLSVWPLLPMYAEFFLIFTFLRNGEQNRGPFLWWRGLFNRRYFLTLTNTLKQSATSNLTATCLWLSTR